MAKVIVKQTKNVKNNKKVVKGSPFEFFWTKNNYIVLAIGLVTMLIGYFLLGYGDWDSTVSLCVAPVILLIVYLVLFPLSIFLKKKPEVAKSQINE